MFFDDGWDGRGQAGREGNGQIDTRNQIRRKQRHAASPSIGAICQDMKKMRRFKDSYSGSKSAEKYRGERSGDTVVLEKKIKSLTLHSVVTPAAGDQEINVGK
jgi:hypothetical protein